MQIRKKINFFSFVLMLFSVLVLTACSGGAGSGKTLYTLKEDMNFPNDVHKELPVPDESSLNMSLGKDGRYFAMVRISTPYPDVLEFYSEALPKYGWEITEEDIPEKEEGERTATWEIKGHGLEGAINFTSFGGPKGAMMSADYHIEEAK